MDLDFDSITPAIYTRADGNWYPLVPPDAAPVTLNIQSYTFPTQWTYFRKVRFSQYNTPNEGAKGDGACKGGPGRAWHVSAIPGTATGSVKNKNYQVQCKFDEIVDPQLNSQFIQQTWINGTGQSNRHGLLQNAVVQNLGDARHTKYHIGCTNYPDGAIGYGDIGGNTVATVSGEIAGSCGKLVPDESGAGPTKPLSDVTTVQCGDKLNLVKKGSHSSYSTRTIADRCPDCNKPELNFGANGHIDSYTGSNACTGRQVDHDLPGSPFYTSMVNQ